MNCKRLLCVLLTVLAVLSFVACAGTQEPAQTSASPLSTDAGSQTKETPAGPTSGTDEQKTYPVYTDPGAPDEGDYAGFWTGKKTVEIEGSDPYEQTYMLTLSSDGTGNLVLLWKSDGNDFRYRYFVMRTGAMLRVEGQEYRKNGEKIDVADDDYVTFTVDLTLQGGKLTLGAAKGYDRDRFDLEADYPVTLGK